MNALPSDGMVDSIFAPYAKPGSPGCAVAIIKDGAVVYKQGYGLADLKHGLPILAEF
jgi:CubicO group peptidase (beta-lactamase class C family)